MRSYEPSWTRRRERGAVRLRPAIPVAETLPGQPATVTGVVRAARWRHDGPVSLEAVMADGSGAVVLRFRGEPPPLLPQDRIVAHGPVTDDGGRRVMDDPRCDWVSPV